MASFNVSILFETPPDNQYIKEKSVKKTVDIPDLEYPIGPYSTSKAVGGAPCAVVGVVVLITSTPLM